MAITANDEPTEIEADVDKRFSSIIVNLPVQQTGTGTPSPSNPRPFTTWTDVSLYVSDTEEADEPTLAIELPTPMYGGKVDMVRGEIATLYNSKESGTDWEMTQEGQFRCQVSAYNNGDETSTNVADLYAVHYETVSNKDAYDATDDLTCGLATIDGTTYLYVNDAQYTTLDSFATHIAEEVFVFRAHIPMSDVTEPHIVYLPEGTSYVWADAGFVDYTVSGTPPLSLPNSLDKPLKAWSVDVLPKQDLNGYDAPWPAGGGVNKYNYESTAQTDGKYIDVNGNEVTNAQWEISDYIPVVAGYEYYTNPVDGSAPAVCWYDENKQFISGIAHPDIRAAQRKITAPTGAAYVRISVVTSQASQFRFNYPSSDTGLYPYSNLCPISGTDKVNLFVEESYDPSATPKAVLTLPQTVYTGTIGSEGGESRQRKIVLNGSENWTGSNTQGIYIQLSDMKKLTSYTANNSILCENLSVVSNNGNLTDFSITGYVDWANRYPTNNWLYIRIDDEHPDATSVKEWLAEHPVTIVYELATPVQFAVTAPTIPTPTGTATTWATAEDGTVDSMEVTYVGKAT